LAMRQSRFELSVNLQQGVRLFNTSDHPAGESGFEQLAILVDANVKTMLRAFLQRFAVEGREQRLTVGTVERKNLTILVGGQMFDRIAMQVHQLREIARDIGAVGQGTERAR
jgi:hypothetical protein